MYKSNYFQRHPFPTHAPTKFPSAHRTGRLAPARCTAVNSVGAFQRFGHSRRQAAVKDQTRVQTGTSKLPPDCPRAAHPRSQADRGGPFRRHLRPPGSLSFCEFYGSLNLESLLQFLHPLQKDVELRFLPVHHRLGHCLIIPSPLREEFIGRCQAQP